MEKGTTKCVWSCSRARIVKPRLAPKLYDPYLSYTLISLDRDTWEGRRNVNWWTVWWCGPYRFRSSLCVIFNNPTLYARMTPVTYQSRTWCDASFTVLIHLPLLHALIADCGPTELFTGNVVDSVRTDQHEWYYALCLMIMLTLRDVQDECHQYCNNNWQS